MRQQRKESY